MMEPTYYTKRIRDHLVDLDKTLAEMETELKHLRGGLGKLQTYQEPKLPIELGHSAKYTEWEKKRLDEAKNDLIAAGKANDVAYRANLALAARVTKMLTTSGFRTGYRSRERGKMKDVDWSTELRHTIPRTKITEHYINSLYTSYETTYANRERESRQTEQLLRQQQDAENEKRKELVAVIKVCQQFNLDTDRYGNITAIEDWLNEQDKYLDLAVAMQDTRGDWSEGFYRVKHALERFKIETETDRAIVDDVQGCMDCEDGRVFRDTEWNYEKIFELVGPATLAAWQEIAEFRE